MNTRLLRRIKWSDLCAQPLKAFIGAPEAGLSRDTIATSEIEMADDKFFGKVDARGYQPFSMFKEKKWFRTGPIKVDDFSDAAMADKTTTTTFSE